MVYAIVKKVDEREANYSIKKLKVGDKIPVKSISMGRSYTTVYLRGFVNSFNSINFGFEEDGKPLNIYRDARFNPYIKAQSPKIEFEE